MFIIQTLPFYQDIREYTFPKMPKVKDDEVVMFEQLIDNMQLLKISNVEDEEIDEDGNVTRIEPIVEQEDMADPGHIFNPSYQYFLHSMMKVIEQPELMNVNIDINQVGTDVISQEIQKLFHPKYDFNYTHIEKLCLKIKEKFKISKIDKKLKRQRIQLSDLLNVNLMNQSSEILVAKDNNNQAKDAKDGTPSDIPLDGQD